MHWFGNSGYAMGHGFGWVLMILFWAVIIVLVLYLVKALAGRSANDRKGSTPEEILKARYARGEITREEYHRMKREIRS